MRGGAGVPFNRRPADEMQFVDKFYVLISSQFK